MPTTRRLDDSTTTPAPPSVTHRPARTGHGPSRYNALVKQLEATGTTVVFVDFRLHPMQNTLPSIKLLGAVLHRDQQANAYIQFYQQHLARVQSVVNRVPEAQRPKVFVDLLAGVWDAGCCHTAGNGNFGEFVQAAGGRNIAQGLVPGVLGDISMEQVIAAQPDVYIATGSRTKPGLASLRVGAPAKPVVGLSGIRFTCAGIPCSSAPTARA